MNNHHGLTASEVQKRISQGMQNQISSGAGRTETQIILANTLTFFNLIFVIMAVLMLVVGSSILNLTFMVVVVVNTVIGCIQEIRAKRAVDQLTLVAAQTLDTYRDGKLVRLRSDELVQDDLVIFTPGDQICADGILYDGELKVNEALVTGEADAVAKGKGDSLLSGSFVISGRAVVQLTQVGDHSYAAKLAAEAKADPKATKSEMMQSLDRLIRFIGFLLIPVGLLLFWGQMAQPDSTIRSGVEATVAALVGMIPEGLYLLTSVALAVSAIMLTKSRVLVQDMNCIETLARVDVLCVDKTGTITEPGMEVVDLIAFEGNRTDHLCQIIRALYADRAPDNDTAEAIAQAYTEPMNWVCREYLPFDSQRKWLGGQFEAHGTFLVGAPELIMGSNYSAIQATTEEYSQNGDRVLLIAAYAGSLPHGNTEPDKVTPLGLLLLSNKLRPNAQNTFGFFIRQGVTIKVISGDNPLTVSRVAQRAGILNAHKYIDTQVLESPEDFASAVQNYTIFGRVTPDKKKLLIQAMQTQGHTVAMTGDGVNDVLAMKESDCGIAMASGAQAASQVSRMVLLDSDFAAMPRIVDEGRRVINNIQRAATLFLVKNIFSMGIALVTLFFGLRFPLESFHLSIVSALTIGIPGFFLAMEPNYERVTGKFLPTTLRRAFPGGLTGMLVVLASQWITTVCDLPLKDCQTIATGILLAGGLTVLYSVCTPFSPLRRFVWLAMAVCVAGAFVVLPPILGYLTIADMRSWYILGGLVAAVPVVYLLMQGLFKLLDNKKSDRHTSA